MWGHEGAVEDLDLLHVSEPVAGETRVRQYALRRASIASLWICHASHAFSSARDGCRFRSSKMVSDVMIEDVAEPAIWLAKSDRTSSAF